MICDGSRIVLEPTHTWTEQTDFAHMSLASLTTHRGRLPQSANIGGAVVTSSADTCGQVRGAASLYSCARRPSVGRPLGHSMTGHRPRRRRVRVVIAERTSSQAIGDEEGVAVAATPTR